MDGQGATQMHREQQRILHITTIPTEVWHFTCSAVCSTYLDHLAEEMNDRLQEAGMINIAELCKAYDLPGDFLTEVSNSSACLYLHVYITEGISC